MIGHSEHVLSEVEGGQSDACPERSRKEESRSRSTRRFFASAALRLRMTTLSYSPWWGT